MKLLGTITTMNKLWNGQIESGVVCAHNSEWKGEEEGSIVGFIGGEAR